MKELSVRAFAAPGVPPTSDRGGDACSFEG
jgi:hypothetical protein